MKAWLLTEARAEGALGGGPEGFLAGLAREVASPARPELGESWPFLCWEATIPPAIRASILDSVAFTSASSLRRRYLSSLASSSSLVTSEPAWGAELGRKVPSSPPFLPSLAISRAFSPSSAVRSSWNFKPHLLSKQTNVFPNFFNFVSELIFM